MRALVILTSAAIGWAGAAAAATVHVDPGRALDAAVSKLSTLRIASSAAAPAKAAPAQVVRKQEQVVAKKSLPATTSQKVKGADKKSLEGQRAALEAELAGLEATLAARTSALRGLLGAIEGGTSPAAVNPRVARLNAEIRDLQSKRETTVAKLKTCAHELASPRFWSVEKRLAALEASLVRTSSDDGEPARGDSKGAAEAPAAARPSAPSGRDALEAAARMACDKLEECDCEITLRRKAVDALVTAIEAGTDPEAVKDRIGKLKAEIESLEASRRDLAAKHTALAKELDSPRFWPVERRLSAIERSIATGALPAATSDEAEAVAPSAPADQPHFGVSGDLRYRHESIVKEGSATRARQRVRARVKVKGHVNDDIDAVFRFASGSDDPVSTNQTLDGGFGSKGLNLDLAYFDWHTGPVHVFGGKMANPFVVTDGKKDKLAAAATGLMWDSDLTLEGVAVNYTAGETARVFVNSGVFWVEEHSSDPDTFLGALQVGVVTGGLKVALGYFEYNDVSGQKAFFDETDGFGNMTTTVTSGTDEYETYNSDFRLTEFMAEYAFKVAGRKANVFAGVISNDGASDNNTGWVAGFSYGKAKKPGTWALKYNFRSLKEDAVVGAFCDSDFGGGGTGAEGHQLGFSMAVAKSAAMGATYLSNTLADGSDYGRLQVDFKVKF
jgi:hypothetical protein